MDGPNVVSKKLLGVPYLNFTSVFYEMYTMQQRNAMPAIFVWVWKGACVSYLLPKEAISIVSVKASSKTKRIVSSTRSRILFRQP